MESNKFRIDCEWDLAELLECLTDNSTIASVLVTIPASSDTEGRGGEAENGVMNLVCKTVPKSGNNNQKNIRIWL